MYVMDFYLNQIPDGQLQLRVDTSATPIGPLFKATLYDANGDSIRDPDYTGLAAMLIVRRSDGNATDQITIVQEVDADLTDNIFFFNLGQIVYEPGNYEAHILLQCTWEDTSATPIGPTTPLDETLAFEAFNIEVLA